MKSINKITKKKPSLTMNLKIATAIIGLLQVSFLYGYGLSTFMKRHLSDTFAILGIILFALNLVVAFWFFKQYYQQKKELDNKASSNLK